MITVPGSIQPHGTPGMEPVWFICFAILDASTCRKKSALLVAEIDFAYCILPCTSLLVWICQCLHHLYSTACIVSVLELLSSQVLIS